MGAPHPSAARPRARPQRCVLRIGRAALGCGAPGGRKEDFQRLVKLLRFAPRFQLLFARIADESYRGLLIDKRQGLLASAGRPFHTADLADDERFPDFEALETWLAALGQGQHDQRLPIAQQMSDIVSIAHIRYSKAHIRLQRGDHRTGGLQQIYDDLAEPFEILRKLGQPDGIGAAGELLAQVLAMRAQKGEALEVLDQAESAYTKLADDQGIARVRSLREAIAGGASDVKIAGAAV